MRRVTTFFVVLTGVCLLVGSMWTWMAWPHRVGLEPTQRQDVGRVDPVTSPPGYYDWLSGLVHKVPVARMYPTPGGQAVPLAKLLQSWYRGQPAVFIVAVGPNSILVIAPIEDQNDIDKQCRY